MMQNTQVMLLPILLLFLSTSVEKSSSSAACPYGDCLTESRSHVAREINDDTERSTIKYKIPLAYLKEFNKIQSMRRQIGSMGRQQLQGDYGQMPPILVRVPIQLNGKKRILQLCGALWLGPNIILE